ncbi:MAG: pyrrolysine--tRNA(Pyl) ligase large subunit [Candidatus Adiutrix sp.]|jgi:phenylalanyl-tRNA synthetase alpha chain|nr:pyrrolysine--tRNA(Pyl) ligase large subunit [Candidatus Adiutrix sp.]
MDWTDEQNKRLTDLGAGPDILASHFEDSAERNRAFQKIEAGLAHETGDKIRRHLAEVRRPELVVLREKLAAALVAAGFTEVETPLTVSRLHLERMGLTEDHSLNRQIFWLDRNKAMRPMLAPNLYYLMVDLLRLAPHPVSIFEIGPCMRKETQGAQHAAEFTMLNLVEMGLPLPARRERMEELARLVLKASGLPVDECRLTTEKSGVYGETLDVESPEGLELASAAMGPHPLDAPWGIDAPWVGLGFGLERLVMARAALDGLTLNPARAGRSLAYLGGFRLNV